MQSGQLSTAAVKIRNTHVQNNCLAHMLTASLFIGGKAELGYVDFSSAMLCVLPVKSYCRLIVL